MRILDINDNELQEQDVDINIGYLVKEKIFIKHHEGTKGVKAKSHFWPNEYYFTDGSKYTVTEEDDPHVKITNAERTSFDWNALDGESEKQVRGIDVKIIEDSPEIKAKEPWDEYEDILRYKLYTQEELDKREEEKIKEERKQYLLNNGLGLLEENSEQINSANQDIEDIVLLLAEILGSGE